MCFIGYCLGIEKRRSGRNTKRKKYVDDVQYNFTNDELKGLSKVGGGCVVVYKSDPSCVFILIGPVANLELVVLPIRMLKNYFSGYVPKYSQD